MSVGVIGFKILSHYTWIDALYMTVITITTVGFGVLHPLSDGAKIFVIFFILTSIIVVGYALAVITEYILSKNNLEELISNGIWPYSLSMLLSNW